MKSLPFLAFLLGLGGLVPFFILATGILFFSVFGPVPRLALGLLSYGAVILSFTGAVHWGLALETPAIVTSRGVGVWDRKRLLLGAMTALWAWGALWCGLVWRVQGGIAVLMAGFVAVLLCERAAWRSGAMPRGYMVLRVVLTAFALLCLATGLGITSETYRI